MELLVEDVVGCEVELLVLLVVGDEVEVETAGAARGRGRRGRRVELLVLLDVEDDVEVELLVEDVVGWEVEVS